MNICMCAAHVAPLSGNVCVRIKSKYDFIRTFLSPDPWVCLKAL